MNNWFLDKKTLLTSIIIGVLIILLLLQRCGNGSHNSTSNDTIRKIDTTYITITKEKIKYIPKWKKHIEYVDKHDTTQITDTVFIINDYNSTYLYQDSLKTDTLSLYINDSISKNKIQSRNIKYSIKFPTITITNTVIKNKNEYYIGLGLVGGKNGIGFFGPELMLRTKKKNVYGVGVGLDGNLKTNVSLRTYWKIGKK